MGALPHLLSFLKSKETKKLPFSEKEFGGKWSFIHICAWQNILLIYIDINRIRSARKMMGYTQKYWSQRDIMNKVIILTKQDIPQPK